MSMKDELTALTTFIESMGVPPIRRVALLHAASVIQVYRGNLNSETLELVDDMTVEYLTDSQGFIDE